MNLFMIVMYSYLAAMGIAVWFYYRTLIPGLTSWMWPLAVVGCTVSYLVSHSGYIVHPEPLARALAWIGNVWILFGFYSLLLMLLNGVLIIPAKIFGVHYRFSTPLAVIGLVVISASIIFGIYKAMNPIVRTETVAATKNIEADTKIVLVTDLHLGHINALGAAQDVVQRINAQKPDLVLIGGDIVDEKLSYVLDNGSLEALKFDAPLGTYAVYGNHDYLDGEMKEIRRILCCSTSLPYASAACWPFAAGAWSRQESGGREMLLPTVAVGNSQETTAGRGPGSCVPAPWLVCMRHFTVILPFFKTPVIVL